MSLIRKLTPGKDQNTSINVLKLLPYWPLFLIVILLSGGCAWIYLQFTTPKYEVHARILIKDEKKGSEDSQALEALDLVSPKKNSDNEIEVLKSHILISDVVYKLNLYAPVFETAGFKDKSAYISSPITVVPDSSQRIRPVAKVPFSFANGKVKIKGQSYPLNQFVKTPYGNLRFVANPLFADEDGSTQGSQSFYFSLLSPKDVVDNIASDLDVEAPNKLASIIDLSIDDAISQRGQDILNQLIDAYNNSLVAEKNSLAENTIKFLDERLASVQQELQEIEKKQENYKAGKGAIDIGTEGKLFLENVSTNDQKESEIEMQLSVLNQINNYVKSKDTGKGIVPSTAGLQDPGLAQMVKNIYDLQLQVESLKKTTGENNPLVVSANDEIEKIKPQILENIENQRQALMATKRDLSSTNGMYSSTLDAMPETEKNLVDINREQNIKSGIYTFLLQKKEETALSIISNIPESKIVDHAESSEHPVSPNKRIVYIAALFLGILVSIGIIIARESLSQLIMFQKDIEELTQVPVIGEITADRNQNPIVIGSGQRTLIAEQFRRLRTTINYLDTDQQKKRIMVTSGISGEGKSFIATNLAISLALTNKKVILVDFDLNKPTLSRKLNIKGGKGVSEYLEGEALLEDIIQPTSINDHLFIIPAGELPENPSELLTNGLAAQLLDKLDEVFDHIIIDVSPVGPVSDAYILSPYCDSTLYVVRHAYTPKTFLERLDVNNKLNKLNNVAIVFNAVSQRGYGQSYGYGYGYGYVYGGDNYVKKLSTR